MKPVPDDARRVPGQRLIFWLFVALSIATAASLLVMAQFVDEAYRPRIYWSLAGDLLIPVIAWFALKAIGKRRAERKPRQP